MAPGDICLASFPVGPIPEVLVAYISSVVPPALLPTDVLVDPSRSFSRPT